MGTLFLPLLSRINFGHSSGTLKKRFTSFVLLFFIAVLGLSIIPTTQVLALTSTDTPTQRAESWAYLNALTWCIREGGVDGPDQSAGLANKLKESDARAGNWWLQNDIVILGISTKARHAVASSYLHPNVNNEGVTACNDVLKTAAQLWGFGSDYIGLLCSFVDKREGGDSCKDGRSNFDLGYIDDRSQNFYNEIVRKVYRGTAPALTGDMEYVLAWSAFVSANGCAASPATATNNPADFLYEDVESVSPSGQKSAPRDYAGDRRSDRIRLFTGDSVIGSGFNFFEQNCGQIADSLSENVNRYLAWFRDNPDVEDGSQIGNDACVEGSSDTRCTADGQAVTCDVEGIGWMLCPIANAMAGLADATFEAVSAFMIVQPLSLSTEDNALYDAWSIMRSIANIAFVIAFLIIIFSQLTSYGVSNYGVKKMLPRLIITAIFVNLSYFAAAVAVDVSNILGVGLKEVFDQIAIQTAGVDVPEETQWASAISSILAGSSTIAIGAVVYTSLSGYSVLALLAGILPLLVGALFALVIALLVLVARQALIIMLIVVAPLAIVAYILPNTESLFKKWKDLFVSLLVLFPMLSLLFGASLLAGVILREANADNDSLVGFLMYVGSFAVQAIPFFITPLLIKLSSGVLNRFAGIINNPKRGPIDSLRKRGEQIRDNERNRSLGRRLEGAKSRKTFMNFGARRKAERSKIASGLSTFSTEAERDYTTSELGNNQSFATKVAGGDVQQGQILAAKARATLEAEELKEAMEPLVRELAQVKATGGDADKFLEDRAKDVRFTATQRSAAMQQAASLGRDGVVRNLQSHFDSTGDSDMSFRLQSAIQSGAGSLVGKAPDLVKGKGPAFANVTGADLTAFTKGTAIEYMKHLDSLSTTDPAKYAEAVGNFKRSIEDIAANPTLQASFKPEVGSELLIALRNSPTIAGDVGPSAAGRIESDGKIR